MTTATKVDLQRRLRVLERRVRALEEAAVEAVRGEIHKLFPSNPKTLDELVAWERKYGAQNEADNERRNGYPASPAFKREMYKDWAREFGVPYATVKQAIESARAEGRAEAEAYPRSRSAEELVPLVRELVLDALNKRPMRAGR